MPRNVADDGNVLCLGSRCGLHLARPQALWLWQNAWPGGGRLAGTTWSKPCVIPRLFGHLSLVRFCALQIDIGSRVCLDLRGQRSHSASGEDWPKTGLAQDAGDLRALIALNLNPAFFHGAPRAAGLLHRFGQAFLLRQTDADEPRDDGDGFAAAMRRLPQDVHPAPIFPRCRRCVRRSDVLARPLVRGRRQRRAA